MALTATATERVCRDLAALFDVQEDCIFRAAPYRANIFRQAEVLKEQDKTARLVQFLKEDGHRPAVVYIRTRKDAENLSYELGKAGFSVKSYHAGMPPETRGLVQDEFLAGAADVLVATIAFGMGIDKPDVRSVVHYHPPASLEAYVQESGRAGRDGLPSFSLVMLSGRDGVAVVNRLHAAEPERHGVKGLASLLSRRGEHIVSLYEASAVHDLPDVAVDRMLFDLKRSGSVREQGMGYKYYKVRPLFRMEEILCGRDGEERSRLQWMDGHREGEVEALAAEWGISWEEAGAWLDELVLSGEWKVDLRQTALHLHSEGFDAEEAAEEFAQYFSRSRLNGLERWKTCVSTLTSSACLNRSLDAYFGFREPSGPCGHCPGCCGAVPAEMELEEPGPLPEELRSAVMELAAQRKPALARPSQLTRFLLGLASPAAMRARLWGHPLYGTLADRSWGGRVDRGPRPVGELAVSCRLWRLISGNDALAGVFRMQQGAPVAGNFLRAAFSFIPGADFLQQRPGDAFRGVFWAERAGIMGNVPCRQFSRGVRRGPTTEAPAQSASAEATCVPSDREVQRLILAWEYFFCSSALGR